MAEKMSGTLGDQPGHSADGSISAENFPVGMALDGGWVVAEKCGPERCGRHSFGYFVKNEDGRTGFLKAINYDAYLYSKNPEEVLLAALAAYSDETRLLRITSAKRLDRIVSLYLAGTVRAPDNKTLASYLIFELAEDDGRKQFCSESRKTYFDSLGMLHDVIVGVAQLHREKIAHQDIRSANVLCFKGVRAKIADLGKAVDPHVNAELIEESVPGDETYAPPELLYNFVPGDWAIRRYGCDLYLVGSLIVSFFLGTGMTPQVMAELPAELRPDVWAGDSYAEVLTYLQNGHAAVLQRLHGQLMHESGNRKWADEITAIVRELCNPDPLKRGDVTFAARGGNRLSLERYMGKIDRLVKCAVVFRKKAA
jgi:serine/threonine protein kinase